MQRVRRDSASSTDSWSIIEQRCSPEVSAEEILVDSDECGSDSEIELAEEAFDSHDSDIEVEDQEEEEEEEEREESDSEGEEDEETEAEQEEEEPELESEEEVDEEEGEEQEAAETPEWGLVSQKEAMSGEGKHFVTPEKIKNRLDSVIERRDNSQKIALFLKVSFACFVIQNVVLFYSMLLSRPIYRAPEVKSVRMQPPFSFKPFVYNNSASLQCWSPRMAALEIQSSKGLGEVVERTRRFSWENFTLTTAHQSWFKKPSIPKSPKPSRYGKTTISRQRLPLQVCRKRDSVPTVPRSIFPCKQASPMPTPPQRKEPQSPFSALKSIIGNSFRKTEPVKMVQPMTAKRSVSPLRSLFKQAQKAKPRARTFNYKMEMSPAPQMCKKPAPKNGISKPKLLEPRQHVKATPKMWKAERKVKEMCPKRGGNVSKSEMMVIPKEWKMSKVRKAETFKPKKMVFHKKKRFSMKASQMMRNSSYLSKNDQCKRDDFKQFKKQALQLEDKSRRRRQRLLEYKVEKPCRAVYAEKMVKKVTKLEGKIQKKIQKIERKIQKRQKSSLSA